MHDFVLYMYCHAQARNDRGFSSLALASDFGQSKVVLPLFTAGANLEGEDFRGNTPIMHASREVKNARSVKLCS